jgi:hypothetical protein
MRQYPDVANVIRTDLLFNYGGPGGGFHLFHKFGTSDGALATYTGWCNWVNTTFENDMAAQVVSGVNLSTIKVTDLTTRTSITTSVAGTATGAKVGIQPPDNACALVNYKINRRYRGGQPRSYMPGGVAQDVSSGNKWASTMLGQYQTAVQAYFAGLLNYTGNLSSLVHVNVSYYSDSTWVGTPPGPYKQVPTFRGTPQIDNIVNVIPSATIGSQRRRLRLGG